VNYFDKHSFKFLRDLARHNERAWFHANKARYEAAVRDPFLALIGDLAEPLAKVSAHYRADAKALGGSLFRIQRDTRFANDKTPYKTHAGAQFFHARGRKAEAPVFYLHLQPGASFIGAGLWHPQPETQRRVRAFLIDNPAAWKKAAHAPAFTRRYALEGDALARAPRGFDPQHELIEDLKRKDFVATRAIDDDTMLGPRLKQVVAEDFARLAPLVDYLCAALDLEF
jgi:uncharacterized protein (TIGR02453 family)